MIRVGVLGRGMAGTVFHAPLIRSTPGLEIAALVGAADAPTILNDPQIDLVVVATPHATHFDLAQAALSAGKHVIIDKPIAASVGEADKLVALAARQQKLLTVFHNRRWDGDFLTVQDILASAPLGQVMLFEAYWDRFRPSVSEGWKEAPGPGAGTLWNLGPHMVDQLLLLLGMPEYVQADISTQRTGAQVHDYFSLTCHYDTARAILASSYLVTSPRPRFALHGTNGSFIKFGLDPQEDALAAGAEPMCPGFGEDRPDQYGTLTLHSLSPQIVPTRTGQYREFYTAVQSALTTGVAPPVDPEDARVGVRLIEAALESADSGRRVRLD